MTCIDIHPHIFSSFSSLIKIFDFFPWFLFPSKGLIQTGAWVIFSDFDCIDANVLSVVAQQMSMLNVAKANRLIKIMFDDTSLKLDISCNIFATINTDFAGNCDSPSAVDMDVPV